MEEVKKGHDMIVGVDRSCEFCWVLGVVLVCSAGFWCNSGGVLVWFLWVLVNSGGF